MKTSFIIVFTTLVVLLGTNVKADSIDQTDQMGQSEILLSEQKRNGNEKNDPSKRLSSDYLYRFVKRGGSNDYLYRFARGPGSDYLYRFARGGNDDYLYRFAKRNQDYLYRFVKRNGDGGSSRSSRLDQDYYTRIDEEPFEEYYYAVV